MNPLDQNQLKNKIIFKNDKTTILGYNVTTLQALGAIEVNSNAL